jgi:Holliday junction resolvasome RuvABC endonuclease subunit
MSGRPRVIGLDLSLTSTGVSDGQSVHAIQTTPDECLEARLDRLVRGVVSFALSPTQWTDDFPQGRNADLAVIEAPAWSKASQTGHEELSALRVMVRHRLWRLGVPYALVPPTTLKLYTTGYGKATKQQMVAAIDTRHGTNLAGHLVKDGRYDMADAYALAAMGYDHAGHPLLPKGQTAEDVDLALCLPHRASLDAVEWPELVSD